jgi:hypothetical protein
MIRSLLALAGLLFTGCGREPLAPPDLPETPLERGRSYTEWFYSGQLDRLWSQFSPELRQVFGTVAGLRKFRSDVQSGAGTERRVLDERVIPWLGSDIYHRTASFSGTSDPVWVQWTIDPTGRVLAFLVQPAEREAPSRFLDYQTRTELSLPFSGEWFAFWGGRSVVENYHAAFSDQRFAYDLLVVRDGQTHAGDPSRNESYFCFGQPILAPGSGTVRTTVDGVPDNRPGQMNSKQPPGNYVVLDHGNGEFSFVAHLQQGSVTVQPGRRVQRGEVLGRCGNSGNSSEAHLHYHLQNTAEFNSGEGLPAQFLNYVVNGRQVPRGEPTRGQRIRPQ